MKKRLDEELVSQGYFDSIDAAMRSILAGEVSGVGKKFTHAGDLVEAGCELHVKGRKKYASRGGLKLEGALDYFDVCPLDLNCVDIGCSTGGFTDCLLKRGAAHVLSVDVGYAQFDWSLRQDKRVTLKERTNIMDLLVPEYSKIIDLAVCDVSFTSILNILPAVTYMLKDDGIFICLIKPQFEAPSKDVCEGGIVKSQEVRDSAIKKVTSGLVAAGFSVDGVTESPIKGAKGNIEYLCCSRLI